MKNRIKKFINEHETECILAVYTIGWGATYIYATKRAANNLRIKSADHFDQDDGTSIIMVHLANNGWVKLKKSADK